MQPRNLHTTINYQETKNPSASKHTRRHRKKKKKTMSLWLNAYLRAIEERDSKEKANESLFDTCVFMNQKTLWRNFFFLFFIIRGQALHIDEINKTSDTRLADRAADLASFPPVPVPPEPTTAPAPLVARIESSSDGKKASREPPRSKASRLFSKDGTTATSLDVLAKVREDLGEAQRSKGVMQAQLQSLNEEVAELRAQSQLDKRRIRELSVEKTNLVKRMRDLDEELKGKAKLLEVCFTLPVLKLFSSTNNFFFFFFSSFLFPTAYS